MKNIFENFKELKKDSRGQSFLFFGFYLIFFIVVIIYLRSVHNNSQYYSEDFEKGDPLDFQVNEINDGNYSYTYTIILDGEKYEYKGKKNQDELFEFQGKEYYHHNEEFYVKENEWVKTANPYLFSDFLYMDNIILLLQNSYYESTTNYNSGKDVYNLLLSTNTINQKIHNIDSDYLEEANKLTISTNEKKEMDQIHYYLNSYCKLNELCKSSLEIIISYDEFGTIEEIKNPMFNS